MCHHESDFLPSPFRCQLEFIILANISIGKYGRVDLIRLQSKLKVNERLSDLNENKSELFGSKKMFENYFM